MNEIIRMGGKNSELSEEVDLIATISVIIQSTRFCRSQLGPIIFIRIT